MFRFAISWLAGGAARSGPGWVTPGSQLQPWHPAKAVSVLLSTGCKQAGAAVFHAPYGGARGVCIEAPAALLPLHPWVLHVPGSLRLWAGSSPRRDPGWLLVEEFKIFPASSRPPFGGRPRISNGLFLGRWAE